jgi:pyrroloquinoline quinone biosynthesis protein D
MNGTAIPKLPRGVRLREDKVRSRWVLLAPERIFEIDGIGVEILKRCDGKASLGAIAADLAKAYDAEIAQVEPDVTAFVKGLAEKRIIDL